MTPKEVRRPEGLPQARERDHWCGFLRRLRGAAIEEDSPALSMFDFSVEAMGHEKDAPKPKPEADDAS